MNALAQAITKLESSSERVCLNFQSVDVEELGALEERTVRVVSNLRFVLNGARSPVNKLPPELLSRIFGHLCIPGLPSWFYPLEHTWGISDESFARINLVCRYWRQAAIAPPNFERQLEKHDRDPRAVREKPEHPVDPNPELKKWPKKVVRSDFEMMKVLGEGSTGKVLLVRHKPTSDLFVLKAIAKKHGLAEQEPQQTLTEQAVLKWKASEGKNPFIMKLWWSFHDHDHLCLVMDFHPGGDLAAQIIRLGRLGRHRARFYAAEIVEGVEGLHKNGVVHRDLKPENVLIGSDGHIVLTDFGLSKQFPDRSDTTVLPDESSGARTETTNAFYGTTEYLAPEVIQRLPHGFEVDWWSFGMMLYEMLIGITPFWACDSFDMHFKVLHENLEFPEGRSIDRDAKGLIRELLQKSPALRLKEPGIKRHPYFSMIDWEYVYYKRYIPPYIPPVDPSNAQSSDETFLYMESVAEDAEGGEERTDSDQDRHDDTDSTGDEAEDCFSTPPQSPCPSVYAQETEMDAFGVFSFKGCRYVVRTSDPSGYEEDEEEGGSVSKSLLSMDVKNQKRSPAEISSPSLDSQRSGTSSNPRKPHTPLKPFTIPRSSKYAGKRREVPGIAVLDKYLEYSSDDDWDFSPIGVGADEERNGSNATSLFARGVFDRYRLTVHHGNHTVSGISKASITEVVSPPLSRRQGRGRTKSTFSSSWNRRNISKTVPTSSPVTNEPTTLTHSNSMDWREDDKSGLTDSGPERTRGPRLTRPRLRPKTSRSGSISEGHQSPEEDGESKKKVD